MATIDYITPAAITLSVLGVSGILIFLTFRRSRGTTPYEAPMERTGNAENVASGKYVVRRRPDCSLQQHYAAIG
jgi:hypothetical protein